MYRITGRNNQYYAVEISNPYFDLSELNALVEGGDVVMYVRSIECLEDIGIDPNDVEIIEQ